mmetsp:Transcript_12010/g.22257  ORF Transcript_12010/g.22257 Transcript_12010/m.22257 type:complete len:126 (-) Transcript_12010:421-798(-)
MMSKSGYSVCWKGLTRLLVIDQRSVTGSARAGRFCSFASSAEKRKRKRQGMTKRERRMAELQDLLPQELPDKVSDGNPFLFLVVFPVVMTLLVVTFRDDLREELKEQGRAWRTPKGNHDEKEPRH